MKQHELFGILSLKLPKSWHLEFVKTQAAKGQPVSLEAIAYDDSGEESESDAEKIDAEEKGVLNIKCFKIETKSQKQQKELLDSVFAETERQRVSESVYWSLEELQGEEEGVDVFIKRWLLCSTKKPAQFVLFIFNYSFATEVPTSDKESAEIKLLEDAIKTAVFL